MTLRGLVVAGGEGRRMRSSGVAEPKPLVRVGGAPLLQWNIASLLAAGAAEICVAVPAAPAAILAFCNETGRPMAESCGATLSTIVETQPLGSIGAARLVPDVEDLIVLNADNLSAIELPDMVRHHLRTRATATIAVHHEPFRIPFGQITIDDGAVTAYAEKPTFEIPICSALTVLSGAAIAAIGPGENIGLPALMTRLIDGGQPVAAYVHSAPWIDVNDASAVALADDLLREHPDRFRSSEILLRTTGPC